MFEDEMTEQNMVTTAEDYYRTTRAEKHDEQLACAKAYIRALEGQIAALKRQRHADSVAMLIYG